jgi:hypothetical protein
MKNWNEKWKCFGGDGYVFYYKIKNKIHEFGTRNNTLWEGGGNNLSGIIDLINFLVDKTDFFSNAEASENIGVDSEKVYDNNFYNISFGGYIYNIEKITKNGKTTYKVRDKVDGRPRT